MDGREFVASLVDSLALPVALTIVALVLRHHVKPWFDVLPSRVKAGPVEVEWSGARSQIPTPIRTQVSSSPADTALRMTAHVSPRSAILERYDEVIGFLSGSVRELLGDDLKYETPGELIDLAEDKGMIDAATKQALVGLTVMRNLAAHLPREVDESKAREFLAFADATDYPMRHWLAKWREAHPPE